MISCDEHLFDHGTDSSVAVWPEVEGGRIVVESGNGNKWSQGQESEWSTKCAALNQISIGNVNFVNIFCI